MCLFPPFSNPFAFIAELLLEDIKKYRFLTNGPVTLRDVDDNKEFKVTNDAFAIMGLTPEEMKDVWRIVSVVLLMGNIETSEQRRGGEQAVISDDSGMLETAGPAIQVFSLFCSAAHYLYVSALVQSHQSARRCATC